MLSVKYYGSKDNPVIMFLHGLMGSKEDFDVMGYILSPYYYCISIDLPGFGSSSIDFSLPLKRLIKGEIIKLLQPIAPVHLAGYSLGGRIALELYSEHPHLIQSLIILSANIGIKEEEKLYKQKQIDHFLHLVETLSPSDFLSYWYSQPLFQTLQNKQELKNTIIRKKASYHKETLRAYFSELAITNQEDLHFILPKIKHGVFFYGESDVYYKNQYNNILFYNPSLQIEEIKQASHAIIEENGACVAEKIHYFLENIK